MTLASPYRARYNAVLRLTSVQGNQVEVKYASIHVPV